MSAILDRKPRRDETNAPRQVAGGLNRISQGVNSIETPACAAGHFLKSYPFRNELFVTTPQELQDKLKLGQEKLKLGLEKARTNSRRLVMVGAGLIVVSFLLSWWSLSKYRVSEMRGVNLGVPAEVSAVTEKMSDQDKEAYNNELQSYATSWSANRTLNHEFYLSALGPDYDTKLTNLDNVSHNGGTLHLNGWSTWTGRFGFIFVLLGVAWFFAPQINPDLGEHAWTAPWVWTALGAILLISTLSFYFNVPDKNGDGYSQGVTLGCYMALLGSTAVVVGGTFEGIKSARERLARLAEQAEEEGEESDENEADDKPAPRRSVPKAPPVDAQQAAKEEKARRLQDW